LTFRFNLPQTQTQNKTHNPVYQVLKMIGFAFVNIDDAPIRLNALLVEHSFVSRADLWDRIKKHYTRCGTRELYKIVGSLEIMGNPIGLFNDITTGVKDFFYEPATAITRNPEEFSKGLAKGSMSLLSKSVHGTFNTLSTFSRNIANVITFLTLEEEHIFLSSYQPLTIKEGLKLGGEAILTGLYEGATDLFTKPTKGILREGIIGFIKGVGLGLLSIPTKPVAGLFVGLTRVTAGISNSQNVSIGRVRHPRMFRDDGTVLPYNEAQSFSHDLLTTANEGRYADTDTVVFYMLNIDKTHVYMLTNRAVMKIKMLNRMVAWRFELYQVENITRSRRTGSISVKFATKNIFGRDQMIKKKLKSKDLKTMNKFAKFLQERVSTMKMQIRSNTM
jgi:vacuolar protein sorting-associated protein 13A/C